MQNNFYLLAAKYRVKLKCCKINEVRKEKWNISRIEEKRKAAERLNEKLMEETKKSMDVMEGSSHEIDKRNTFKKQARTW